MGVRRVLVVEDDEQVLGLQVRELRREARLDVTGVQTFREARRVIDEAAFDVGFVDLHLEPGWGVDLVGPLRRKNPACDVVVLTGMPDMAGCRDAFREGAADVVFKNGDSIDFRRAFVEFALGDRLTISDGPSSRAPASLDHVARLYIHRVVNHCEGNLSKAAGLLGISRGTLYRRLREPFPEN